MLLFKSILFLVGLPIFFLAVHTIYRAAMCKYHRIDAPGIDETGMVMINGIRQFLQIRGKNLDNPVLLVLHGGPGAPLTAMIHSFNMTGKKIIQ